MAKINVTDGCARATFSYVVFVRPGIYNTRVIMWPL
jgi:hypothetical protein